MTSDVSAFMSSNAGHPVVVNGRLTIYKRKIGPPSLRTGVVDTMYTASYGG